MFNIKDYRALKNPSKICKKTFTLLIVALSLLSFNTIAASFTWNTSTPSKTPTAANDNGKRILFDVSHGGTEGNADWVLNGAFSDFADALVAEGYTVEEYRGVDLNNNGNIEFFDDYNTPANVGSNEAVITYNAIAHADVLVLAETNRPFTVNEYAALKQFVDAGKGIFFIADHYDADRNINTWDATEVFNGYNRSDLNAYNLHAHYGDLRNPKAASAGWLAQNFGIRFRFNAVDYKQGVSGIEPPAQTENLTQGVGPVLMAAGATLAITDNTKAKGLVYFAASDTPQKWTHAKDSGIYFGGTAEGPYVAIAKSGLGKAAFIGDSSPIEDASPTYKRQDNGNTKKTYPGWTDAGNAAQLSINIINWLATTESYTHFNTASHPAGTLTPTPMATTEKTDPNNGNPWTQPNGNYQPWNPNTFANGAYGAPCPTSGCNGSGSSNSSTGNSSSASNSSAPTTGTVSVSQALASPSGAAITVEGVISAELNGVYALLLADTNNNATTINIKLESSQRAAFSPNLNPSLIGQLLRVTGIRDTYLSGPSIESVSHLEIITPNTALTVTQALNEPVGSAVIVEGTIAAELNGIYALLLKDNNNAAITLNVKLESNQRTQFSPNLNPALIGTMIRITGIRDNYMSGPSIEYISAIEVLNNPSNNPQAITVTQALTLPLGSDVTVQGIVSNALNGIYALLLNDSNDVNTTINVKLESSQRSAFSPNLNPSILGKTLFITGQRDTYMSGPSIESISEIIVTD